MSALEGRDGAALSTVRADIERSGGHVLQVGADVTRFAEIEATMSLGRGGSAASSSTWRVDR